MAIGRRVWERLHGRIEIAGGMVEMRASVGVAVSGPGVGPDALVARADAAMYEAKRLADDGPVLFTRDLSISTQPG